MAGSLLDVVGMPADRRLRYGAAKQHFMDVRFPPAQQDAVGAVMNIHGGFWRAQYDLIHAGHLCGALSTAGYLTFNIEYRRVGDEGGGWPGTFNDVVDAFRFVRQFVERAKIDPVIVMGHSAGAQLAFALAARESSACRAISLAGVLDLQRAFELHLSNDAVLEFLSGDPEEVPERYREASPYELKIAAKQIIIAGSEDDTVPPEISRDYVRQKQAAGETVELVEVASAAHMDLIDPSNAAFHYVLEAVHALT